MAKFKQEGMPNIRPMMRELSDLEWATRTADALVKAREEYEQHEFPVSESPLNTFLRQMSWEDRWDALCDMTKLEQCKLNAAIEEQDETEIGRVVMAVMKGKAPL